MLKRIMLIGYLVAAMVSTPTWADLKFGLRALDSSDYPTALRELTPVAEGGDATAQFSLGKIYLYGWGVKKDGAEAVKWFRKAAEQGNAKARDMLVYIYEHGEGVEKNMAEAEYWRHMDLAKNRAAPAAGRAESNAKKEGGKIFLPNIAREGRSLSREQAGEHEKQLKANPNDLVLRARLLGYYYNKATQDVGKQAAIQSRRRHILWIIQNQPGSEIASLGEAILAPASHRLADKEGYKQAKASWLKQAEIHQDKPLVLLNAVNFLQLHDKPQAEMLLKKGDVLYPQDPSWKARLGYLYALGILGVDGLNTNGIPTSVNPVEQDGPFAHKARKKAEESTSPVLVGTTGALLGQYGLMIRAMGVSTRDYGDLAEKFLLKAQSMDPDNKTWAQVLGEFYSLKSLAASSPEEKARWSRKSLEQTEKGLEQASDPEGRAYQLIQAAKTAFNAGAFDKAEKSAKELLVIAESHQGDEKYGQAVHDGNMILGRLALRRNDVNQAKMYLLKAGRTAGGGTLSSFGPNMSLAKELFERGEREAVVQYLQLCKKFWTYPRNPLDQWIQDIREGRQPNFAQNLNY